MEAIPFLIPIAVFFVMGVIVRVAAWRKAKEIAQQQGRQQ